MSEMSQKEEYLYIIKNHDIQKLINDSNLPESDKNIIKEKVLSNDVDLSEKLKILNYLLKYQRSEHYRGEVIINETTGFEKEKSVVLEPGYYLLEMNGGNAGCLGAQPNDMPNLVESSDHKSIYNFIIQESRFYNVEDESSSLYFTTDFKWHLFTQEKYLCGSFELNSKGVFLHLDKEYRANSGYNFRESIGSSNVPKSLLANLDETQAIVHNKRFYDYSGVSLDPLNFNSSYRLLDFKKIGKFKNLNADYYKPFSVMECFGIPLDILDSWNNKKVDLANYPKYKEFIENYVNKKVDSSNDPLTLPVSCTEKSFPINVYLNRNKPAGGSGGKLIKVLKINKTSTCGYIVGESGSSSFNKADVSNGSSTIFRIKDKNDKNKSIYIATAEGGFATEDGITRLNDTNNDTTNIAKTWKDSIDQNKFKVEKNDISFDVGEKSFLKDSPSSLDYFSGRSFISYKESSDIEVIDDFGVNNIFYGSDIKGQGCHLNDFENAYYQDSVDGFIKLTFLGPQSSEKFEVSIDCDKYILSTSKKFNCPSSSTIRFEVKLDSQKRLLDLKSSKVVFFKDDISKEISVFDLYQKTELYENDEDFKFTDLKIIKKNEYYIFEFKAIKNLNFKLVSTDENRFLLYDSDLIGQNKEILSIKSETSNELLTINGSSIDSKSIDITYKNNDYSFDSYLTSLYNHERLIEEFDGLKRYSKLSFINNHNIFIPFNDLYKKVQITFTKGNGLELEEIRNLNNEVILKGVPDATIKSIEYCFSLDEELKPFTESVVVTPNQVVYVKITFNTFRIRVSKVLSGLQSKQTLYPLNFDLKSNSMNEDLENSIQWLVYTCNDFSEKVVLNIERNTFKLKQRVDLYNLTEYKTIDNKEEYEYGEEVAISLNLKKELYLSIRDILPLNTNDEKYNNDYLLNHSKKEIYESSLIVGNCENTIRFGLIEQYDKNKEFGTFIELLKGSMITSRLQNDKQNIFFTTLDKSLLSAYPDDELVFLKFKMPQNNLTVRLTSDFNPSSRLLDTTSGSDSYTYNKNSYCRLISSGGNTGKGGNGASAASLRVECRSGGSGSSGFIGGGGGNGSNTSDWSPFWELPYFGVTWHTKRIGFTLWGIGKHWSIKWGFDFIYHWYVGLRNFVGGPPGAGGSGFLDGGAAGTKGVASFENSGKITPYKGSDDNGGLGASEGFSISGKGASFSKGHEELSKYRGRIIDAIVLLDKKSQNQSANIFGVCGINGTDGGDSVGSPNEPTGGSGSVEYLKNIFDKDVWDFQGTGVYSNALWHYEASAEGGHSISTQPAVTCDGTAMSAGAPSAGLPSLVSTSNSSIILKKMKDECLLTINKDVSQDTIIIGGGVDGASAVVGEPHSTNGEDANATWNVVCWKYNLFDLLNTRVIRDDETFYALKVCERYKGTGSAYLPYLLLPIVKGFGPDDAQVEYPFYRDPSTGKYGSGGNIYKIFGNGGGNTIKKIKKSKDYKLETWLGSAGNIGTVDSMYKSMLSQDNKVITVFPPCITDEITSLNLKNSKIDFTSYNGFFKSIEKISVIPEDQMARNTKPSADQCNSFKRLSYRTIVGEAPNNNPLVRIIYLGPKLYNLSEDSQSVSLSDIMSSSKTTLKRNWYYAYNKDESIVDEF